MKNCPKSRQAMNTYYREHDLWTPVTAGGLAEFRDQSLMGIHPNELWVLTRGSRLLAGFSLSDRTRLVRMQIQRASAPVRLLGALLGILPRSGELRSLTIRRIWYQEGELEAGRNLWEQARYQFRNRGSSLGIAYDPTDNLGQVFRDTALAAHVQSKLYGTRCARREFPAAGVLHCRAVSRLRGKPGD